MLFHKAKKSLPNNEILNLLTVFGHLKTLSKFESVVLIGYVIFNSNNFVLFKIYSWYSA